MPIYGYGLLGAPYVLDKEIKYSDLTKIAKLFNNCLYKFQKTYPSFVHSIDLNFKMEYNYIAKYNMDKSGLDEYKYMELLKQVIKDCNELMLDRQVGAYKNRKLDITGTWTNGVVIIMVKNKNSILNK